MILFKIQFNKSKSKYYQQAIKCAGNFYEHNFEDDRHIITITVKELFEKWDYFNELFWLVAGWSGSTLGYDDYNLHSLSDKKRMFYSLQLAHARWICLSEQYLSRLSELYFEESFDEDIRDIIFNEQDVDNMLDLLIAERHRQEYKSKMQDNE